MKQIHEAIIPQPLSQIKDDVAYNRYDFLSILVKENKPCSSTYFRRMEPEEETQDSHHSSGNLQLPGIPSVTRNVRNSIFARYPFQHCMFFYKVILRVIIPSFSCTLI